MFVVNLRPLNLFVCGQSDEASSGIMSIIIVEFEAHRTIFPGETLCVIEIVAAFAELRVKYVEHE